MDPLTLYRNTLNNEAAAKAVSEGLYQHEAFLSVVLDKLVASEELEDGTLCYYRGRGTRNRALAVDAYDLSGDDDTVSLVILDYDGEATPTTRTWTQVTKALGTLAAFAEECLLGNALDDLEPSSPAYGLMNSLRKREVAIARFVMYYVTDGIISNRTRDFVMNDVGAAHVEWRAYDVQRLYSAEQAGTARESIIIDFRARHCGFLPCLQVRADHGATTYLVALPGNLLADLYHEHGTRLLESNVRAYLSGRGKINKGIRQTLQNEPERFLPFNNGVTATASAVELLRNEFGTHLASITDLQIVNGGQTTASLFYSRRDYKADLSDVWVQMKLVEVDASAAEELVPQIARYANSQNKVNETDFFANHLYHQELERLSQRILVPAAAGSVVSTHWYYERTRGAWENERNRRTSAAMQKAFEVEYPKSQVITKTDAAKYLVAWEGRPHVVSQGAQKNFLAFASQATTLWERDRTAVNELYFRELVAKAIIFKELRAGVLAAEWYDKGYLANITAYTLAMLPLTFQRQFKGEVDLERIWRSQAVDKDLLEASLNMAEAITGVLTSDRRPVVNVTEWAKREECWSQVKQLPLRLPDRLESLVVGRADKLERLRAASYVQRLDNSLLDEVALYQKGPEYWEALESFAKRNRLLTEQSMGILRHLRTRGAGSDAQMRAILKLAKKAESLGFRE